MSAQEMGRSPEESGRVQPTSTTPGGTVTRLSLNINEDAREFIRAYSTLKGVSATETIRRALGVLKFVTDALLDGNKILIEDKRGKLKHVEFL